MIESYNQHHLKKFINYFLLRDKKHISLPLLLEHFDEIIRRGADIGTQIVTLKNCNRIMPIAQQEILDLDNKNQDLASGKIWIAQSLSSARGRGSRKWWAPKGGIYMCIAISPILLPEHWGLYSIALGVAISEALYFWGFNPKIRWINDVLINNKKVAGVLSQSFKTPNTSSNYIIFGIGLNVNISNFPKYLNNIATSLSLESQKRLPMVRLCTHIISRIIWNFGLIHFWEAKLLEEEISFNPLIYSLKKFSNFIGKKIIFGYDVEKSPEFEAIVKDIDQLGRLILLLKNGQSIVVNAGEIRYL